MKTNFITNLKQVIREWFATLSVEEIIVNRKLSHIFEKIEYLIAQIEELNLKGEEHARCTS